MEKKFIIDHLLRPHWKALAVAFVAVIIDGMADLFGPWPIKIVLDYVVGSHHLPSWAAGVVIATFGEGKWAILRFAAIATLAITALGAAASYRSVYYEHWLQLPVQASANAKGCVIGPAWCNPQENRS
jgi:subfamily B ATP-binding cassette protein MsbA